uniref:Uncharacterized protein n=1 Tax=Babesia bovis TaxID=5865 RepID=S6B5E6_BABBO|nr:hypothetical protein [Babesia bovis]
MEEAAGGFVSAKSHARDNRRSTFLFKILKWSVGITGITALLANNAFCADIIPRVNAGSGPAFSHRFTKGDSQPNKVGAKLVNRLIADDDDDKIVINKTEVARRRDSVVSNGAPKQVNTSNLTIPGMTKEQSKSHSTRASTSSLSQDEVFIPAPTNLISGLWKGFLTTKKPAGSRGAESDSDVVSPPVSTKSKPPVQLKSELIKDKSGDSRTILVDNCVDDTVMKRVGNIASVNKVNLESVKTLNYQRTDAFNAKTLRKNVAKEATGLQKKTEVERR